MHRLLAYALLPFLFACSSGNSDELTSVVVRSGDISHGVQVEIADDPEERAVGLMHREHLPEGRGMLFVFEQSQEMSFWMKNTLIPLDVLYFDEAGNFVSVQTMEPCRIDPCQTYPSNGIAKYALEVNAGVAKKWGVGEGWELQIGN